MKTLIIILGFINLALGQTIYSDNTTRKIIYPQKTNSPKKNTKGLKPTEQKKVTPSTPTMSKAEMIKYYDKMYHEMWKVIDSLVKYDKDINFMAKKGRKESLFELNELKYIDENTKNLLKNYIEFYRNESRNKFLRSFICTSLPYYELVTKKYVKKEFTKENNSYKVPDFNIPKSFDDTVGTDYIFKALYKTSINPIKDSIKVGDYIVTPPCVEVGRDLLDTLQYDYNIGFRKNRILAYYSSSDFLEGHICKVIKKIKTSDYSEFIIALSCYFDPYYNKPFFRYDYFYIDYKREMIINTSVEEIKSKQTAVSLKSKRFTYHRFK